MGLFTKVFGTYSQRELKSIYPIVDKITALEEDYKKLTDAQLQAKTPEFKERLANGETLDDILPEAFATVREAADRVLGMRPYPVQLVGGIVLHQGRIAEMKTGEGKTLVATLPAYLNALTGNGVHIVTVNDYLAKRDSEWMGKVHRFLGLTVGLIIHDMDTPARREAYAADDLHREVLHAQHAPCGLAADGKGIGQDIIGGLAVGQLLLEHSGLCLQVGIRHGGIFFFQSQHLLGNGVDLFQLPIGKAAKEFFNKGHW